MRKKNRTRPPTDASRFEAPCFEALEQRQLLSGLPIVTLMQMDKIASEEGENLAKFGMKRTGSTAQPLTVYYSIGGSATPNVDYVGLSGVITIPAGKRFAALPVLPIDDFDVEGEETIRITVIKPGVAKYALNTEDSVNEFMVIKLREDDQLPGVRLVMPDREASEYGPNNGLFVITRTGPLELPLTVNLRVSGSANGDASKGPLDFVAIPTTITFAPGVDRYEIEVDALNDNQFEGDEIVRITILDRPWYERDVSSRKAFSNTLRIFDRPLVTMFVSDPVGTTDGDDTAAFFFHRSGPLDSELRVKFNLAGNAVEGNDYEDLVRTVIFAPGQRFVEIRVIGLGTSFAQAYRTVKLTVANGPQYNLNPNAYSGEIRLYDDLVSPAV